MIIILYRLLKIKGEGGMIGNVLMVKEMVFQFYGSGICK